MSIIILSIIIGAVIVLSYFLGEAAGWAQGYRTGRGDGRRQRSWDDRK